MVIQVERFLSAPDSIEAWQTMGWYWLRNQVSQGHSEEKGPPAMTGKTLEYGVVWLYLCVQPVISRWYFVIVP